MSKGRIPLMVGALAMLATALRLPTLANAGIWRDEANVYVELGASSFGGFLQRVSEIDYHPPLYFILEYFWSHVAGVGEIAFQLLPLAFSIATVPVVYVLGKAAGSRAVGLLAAGLFAIAPLAITYSTDYLYPVAIFTNALLALQVTAARKADLTAKAYVLTAGASLLAVYSHYTALIFIPLLAVWALFSPRGLGHGARVATAIVAGALTFVFWLPVFLHQHHVGQPYHAAPGVPQIGSFILSALALIVPVPPSLVLVVIFVAILLTPMLLALREPGRSDCGALGIVSLCAIVIVAAAGLSRVRYVLPFCTLLYVFVAWAFVALAERLRRDDAAAWSRWGAPAAAVLALALLVTNSRYALADGQVSHSGIRTYLASVPADHNTLYVVAPDYMAPTFAYYARAEKVPFIGFARFDHPEYYVLDGYADLWNDPLLLQKALETINRERSRYRYLVIIMDAWTHDAYRVPFGKSRQLVTEIRRRYPLISHMRYEGRWEPVSVYRFDMAAKPHDAAGAWTQFRLNPRHDATLAGTLRVSWRTQTDGGYSSSLAVDGDTLYAGNNAGSLYAINLRTGAVRWRFHVRASLMSNPLLWNGLVIVGEGDQNYHANFWDLRHPMKIGATENALFAVDERTGNLRWRTPISGTGMPTPAIIDGTLIHHNGGGEIVFLDPATGEIVRRVDAGGGATMSAILPLRGDRFATIGMFGGGPLILLTGTFETTVQERSSQDGRLLWSVKMPGAASGVGDCPPASDGRFILCNYVAVNEHAGIGPGAQAMQRAYAFDERSGALRWDVPLERGTLPTWNRSAIPLVIGDTVYFGSPLGPYVHALATESGMLRWRMKAKAPVKGGIVAKAGILYFGDRAGYLWSVDAATGKTIGVKSVRAPFNVGSPVIVGDTLFSGTNKGAVIAVPLDDIRSSRDR